MRKSILLVKQYSKDLGPCLIPAYKSDADLMAKIKQGKEYRYFASDERNPKHHRKLMAILRVVVAMDKTQSYMDEVALLSAVKEEMGCVRRYRNFSGELKEETDSISFANMGQSRFETFYQKAVDICAQYLGISPLELEQNLSDYM
jgi:hypothetical protein